jgi:hypothetical protein
MAYTKNIEPNTSDSHQTSPAYVLTFVRWKNRDTKNYKLENYIEVRKPLVVVNDATELSVQNSKSSPSPVFSCTLRAGDINYLTAVHPGDFVLVNMVNWEEKAMEIRQRALDSKPINRYGDGFKGIFKIMDVRAIVGVDALGSKQYLYQINARGFDEFNTVLYFNPAIVDVLNRANPIFFLNAFDKNWSSLVQRPETNNVQELVKSVIKTTIGTGTKKVVTGPIPQNEIPRYLMPPLLGKLINRNGSLLTASDINNYYVGIWNPGTSTSKNAQPKDGFNSFFKKTNDGNFFQTTKELPGSRRLAPQDFSNVSVWSLLTNYSNSVLNEIYVCYRLAEDGFIYPSLVVRQKPFNSRHYKSVTPQAEHTQFLDLPRWKVSPDLITSLNLGRNESGRINFVQIFTRALAVDPQFNQAQQIALGNYVADEDDIKRSGMKPYIATCNYDYPADKQDKKKIRGEEWAKLVGDWLLEGHLKMNGMIQCVGIEEPICIGDNLELDKVVYHIENISHNMAISADGLKTFRTTLSLSMGVDTRSSEEIPVYAEMDHTDSFTRRLDDHQNEKILPGFSDSQDVPGRDFGEEVKETRQKTFTNPQSSNKGKKE